jgi:hypothetical protein
MVVRVIFVVILTKITHQPRFMERIQEEDRKKFVLAIRFLIMMKRNRSMLRKTIRVSYIKHYSG